MLPCPFNSVGVDLNDFTRVDVTVHTLEGMLMLHRVVIIAFVV